MKQVARLAYSPNMIQQLAMNEVAWATETLSQPLGSL